MEQEKLACAIAALRKEFDVKKYSKKQTKVLMAEGRSVARASTLPTDEGILSMEQGKSAGNVRGCSSAADTVFCYLLIPLLQYKL